MRTIICGDLHGAYKALLQCLERSSFDYENDTLIQLGDVVDGWNQVYECVEELLKIKNLITIKGNHDDWFLKFIEYNSHPTNWLQGGEGTLQSYCNALNKEYWINSERIRGNGGGFKTNLTESDIPETHRKFFIQQAKYYKDNNNNIFVHGGFNRHELLNNQHENDIFWWDRDLWMQALSFKDLIDKKYKLKIKEDCKEVFIGHTATVNWKSNEEISKGGIIMSSKGDPIDYPMNAANIWNLDTGAGFKGRLTFMDLETKEYWQSDPVQDLYSDQKGRN
jgi:serine/threonine protein phosphatase 1